MLLKMYTPKWKDSFTSIKSELVSVIGNSIIKIEHVGSTAVPGLWAKPIIDIDIVYKEGALTDIVEGLKSLGYYHNGDQGIPKREAFLRSDRKIKHPVLDSIRHHLYACPSDSPELKRHLLFRDYLRANRLALEEYQSIKLEIDREAKGVQSKYAEIKEVKASSFINNALNKAEELMG